MTYTGKKNVEAVLDHRRRTKLKLVAGFGGKCGICSYDKCVAALDFHHIDPTEKEFTFSDYQSKAWHKVVAEIKKCAMLCANCHREVHAGVLTIPGNIHRFDENLIGPVAKR